MAKNTKKLNLVAMKKASAAHGLKAPKGKAESVAKWLEQQFAAKGEIVACHMCGYAAPEDEETCPFCGVVLGKIIETSKPAKPAKKKAGKGKGKGKASDETAIAPVEEEEVDLELANECREHVEKIIELNSNITNTMWDIGQELTEIHDKKLFKHMGYRSWSAFCSQELDYTKMTATLYMSVTSLPREDALKIGVSKAAIVAQLPAGKKKNKALDMALAGKTRKQILDYVNKGKAPTDKQDKITIVARVDGGDVTVPWQEDDDGRYVEFEVVTGILLRVWEDEAEDSLVFRFEKP